VLLLAVAIVVFGSLAGEYAGVQGWLGAGLWFWVGHQGWEYLDLGRLWQMLLVSLTMDSVDDNREHPVYSTGVTDRCSSDP
jgi:nitric oxide reductase large subunit